MNVEKIMQDLERKHPGEVEFLQAVREELKKFFKSLNASIRARQNFCRP